MKLIVQIPAYNEEGTLPLVLESIPARIDGISEITVLVLDDGSVDKTVEVAVKFGAEVVSNNRNFGLAKTFKRGLEESLKRNADIIVNIDGDNQYKGQEIPLLIAPIIGGKADIVIGDRQTHKIEHFSILKKWLQKFGSFIVRTLSGLEVTDAVSGFRALNRESAARINIFSNFTYTIEMLLQARAKSLTVHEVKIETNPKERESRLFSNIFVYITFSIATIIRFFTLYNPLRVFVSCGSVFFLLGVMLGARFLYFFLAIGSNGHVQSLILSAIFMIIGALIILFGLLADLIHFNRCISEEVLAAMKLQNFNQK